MKDKDNLEQIKTEAIIPLWLAVSELMAREHNRLYNIYLESGADALVSELEDAARLPVEDMTASPEQLNKRFIIPKKEIKKRK